jgi:hypothetical protein
MLTHPTHDRLLALGLTGIASALEEQRRSTAFDGLSFEERLGVLVDREVAERDAKSWRRGLSSPPCARMQASKISTCARRVALTAVSWRILLTVVGSPGARTC